MGVHVKEREENNIININLKSFFTKIYGVFAVSILIAMLTMTCIIPAVATGNSMYPTLRDGDTLMLNKIVYKFSKPKNGDIIVAKMKNLSVEYIIKRIIATPGQHLVIRNNRIFLDNKLLNEDYLPNKKFEYDDLDIVIPEGYYFVMGDNRDKSIDSRNSMIGLIEEKQLYGKIMGY